jgi:threonine aldolase
MLSFESDYTEGAHEKILEKLLETNREKLSGYGKDIYCQNAKEKIKSLCHCKHAEVAFLVGGTQTNATVIDALLHSCEGVIAPSTGHISLHEAGAIEASGHKVLEIPEHHGKIKSNELRDFLQNFWCEQNKEHMVYPGMVYLSHPTEYGTLYTAKELQEIAALCRQYKIPLYLDGARLGYALAAQNTDVTLPLLASLCDVFYIGGTKVGALCGEAIVFPKNNMPKQFMNIVKQHGALLAKGRLLGIQFDCLFTDNLYFEISAHGNHMAKKLKEIFQKYHFSFYIESPTNQQFIILNNHQIEKLKNHVAFSFWERLNEQETVVRFATSWATEEEDIQALDSLLSTIL